MSKPTDFLNTQQPVVPCSSAASSEQKQTDSLESQTSLITAVAPCPDLTNASHVGSIAPQDIPVKRVNTREIWSLTWPQALMMLCQFMVGFTDTFVAGRIDATVQAAMGIITQCLFFLLVVGIALANGGVAAMSQALGARLPMRAERYVGLLIKIGAVFCLLACLSAYFLRHELFYIIQVPQHIYALTEHLWLLFIPLVPAQYLMTLCASIFRSRKNVWVPFYSGVIVATASVVLSLYLALGWYGGPKLGAEGIIYANLVAVYSGVAFNVFMLIKQKILTPKSFSTWRWERLALPYVAKVAIPSGGLQILWQLGYMMLFSITNTLPGNDFEAVAGLTAGLRIEAIMFLPTMAFSATASILVGQCLGAGEIAEAKRVALRVVFSGVLFMSFIGMLIYPFRENLGVFIAPDSRVNQIATLYLSINIISAPFAAISMIFAGIMTGAGATVYSFIVFSCAIWLIRLPAAFILGHWVFADATGVFLAMLLSQVAQAVAAILVLVKCNWYRFASTAKRFKLAKV